MSARRTTTRPGCNWTTAPTSPGTAPTAPAASRAIRRAAAARPRTPARCRATTARAAQSARAQRATASTGCSLSSNTSQSSCTPPAHAPIPVRPARAAARDDNACSNSDYTSRRCEHHGTTGAAPGARAPGPPATWTAGVWSPATWTPKAHTTWNGCVTDRGSATAPGTTAGNDQKVTTPTTGDPTTLFYPEQYGYCSPEMMGLNYNWTTMKTAVDGLYPNGSTNQPIGLVWGWQSLVGGGPMTMPAKDANYTYKEVIILLSDGLNTQNRWNGNGSDHVHRGRQSHVWVGRRRSAPARTSRTPGSRSTPSR